MVPSAVPGLVIECAICGPRQIMGGELGGHTGGLIIRGKESKSCADRVLLWRSVLRAVCKRFCSGENGCKKPRVDSVNRGIITR